VIRSYSTAASSPHITASGQTTRRHSSFHKRSRLDREITVQYFKS
jgi:hypothetical protein